MRLLRMILLLAATSLLLGCGPKDSTVDLSELAESFEDRGHRKQVAGQIAELPAERVPELFEIAKQRKDPYVAAMMFSALNVTAKRRAAYTAGRALSSEHVSNRLLAALVLRMLVADSKSAGPQLIAALDDEYSEIRIHAAVALTGSSYDRQKSVAALKSLTQDPDAQVRLTALASLEHLANADEILPELIVALKDRKQEVARRASFILARMGPVAQPAVPTLIVATHFGDVFTCCDAIRALGAIGDGSDEVITRLNQLTTSEHRAKQVEAISAIGKLGAKAAKAVGALISLLQTSEDKEIIKESLQSLAQIGPAAKAALPIVTQLQDHDDNSIRRSAAAALLQIDPP